MEIWRDIVGYEGLYKVSNRGRVFSCDRLVSNRHKLILRRGKILKQRTHKQGYKRVKLTRFSDYKIFLVHRLVAIAFIENPENKDQINHINEIKEDNKVSNLEWVSAKENSNHGTRTQRMLITRFGKNEYSF